MIDSTELNAGFFFPVDSYYRGEKKNDTTKESIQLVDLVGLHVLFYHLWSVLYIG